MGLLAAVALSLRRWRRKTQLEVKDAKEVHVVSCPPVQWHAHVVGDKGLIFGRLVQIYVIDLWSLGV
jgi:hypothetical protein